MSSGAGVRSTAWESERLARLEERIARLEALLSAEGRLPERAQREERAPRPAAATTAGEAPPTPHARPTDEARAAEEPVASKAATSTAAPPASAPGSEDAPTTANTYGSGAGGGDASGDPFFEEIRGRWPAFLEFLRTSRHVQQEAFLREGTPGRFEDGELTVFFSPNHRFHQANVAHERNRTVVEQALRKFFGREIQLKAVLGEPPPEASLARRARADGEARPQAAQPLWARPGSQRPAPPAAAPLAQAGAQAGSKVPGPAQPPVQGSSQMPAQGSAPGGTQELPDEFDEPLLRAALKLFGGTITKLERKESDAP